MIEDDPPLTRHELAELKRIRIGKPPSYAAPNNSYQNPEATAHYSKEKEGIARKRERRRK